MFQYFSETIINDASTIKQVTDKKGVKHLVIDGVAVYKAGAGDINKIYKRAYQPEVKEKLVKELTVGDVKAGDVVRLKVGTFQQGLVTSIYADSQLKHVKPFFVEIEVVDPLKVGTELAAALTKQLNLSDFKFFTVTADETDTNKITLEGADCYTKFAEVELVKLKDVDKYSEFQAYDPLYKWDGKYTEKKDAQGEFTDDSDRIASEGNGTVTRLIKDLRVPTETNHAPFAPDFGGRPIPGSKYDQYVVETITERREMGVGVVGANTESFTKQIIFANQAEVSAALDAGFTFIGVSDKVEEVK